MVLIKNRIKKVSQKEILRKGKVKTPKCFVGNEAFKKKRERLCHGGRFKSFVKQQDTARHNSENKDLTVNLTDYCKTLVCSTLILINISAGC